MPTQHTYIANNLIIPDIIVDEESNNEYALTTIGEKAFYTSSLSYSKLSGNLTIPDSVTSIGDRAFNTCFYAGDSRAVERILTIPHTVQSIGLGVFGQCDTFETIRLTNFDKDPSDLVVGMEGSQPFEYMRSHGKIETTGKWTNQKAFSFLKSRGLGQGWNPAP